MATNQGTPAATRSGQRQEGFSLEPPEGTQPCLHPAFSPVILISDSQPVRAYIAVVLRHSGVRCLSRHREIIATPVLLGQIGRAGWEAMAVAQQWNQASDLPGGGLPLQDIGGTPNAPRNQCRQDPQSVQQGTLREGSPRSNWGLMGPEELFSLIWDDLATGGGSGCSASSKPKPGILLEHYDVGTAPQQRLFHSKRQQC